MEKIKIAMITNDLNINGISSVVMSYCKYLCPETYEITVICGSPVSNYNCGVLEQEGIKVYKLPSRKKKILQYHIKLIRILAQNNYDIVHVHGNSATMVIPLSIAKVLKVKMRIAHCHSDKCEHPFLHKLLSIPFKLSYTHAVACSVSAGEWIFKEGYKIIINGIDTNRFRFSERLRNQTRKELYIADEDFVYGHVGRMNAVKNQEFIIDLFSIEASKNPRSKLVLVGTGPNFEHIKQLVKTHQYRERIILYGECNDTSKIYNALDCFILPSLHEGFGIVAIEAQINGLPCIVSTNVPEEVDFSRNVRFCSINRMSEWITHMEKIEHYIIEQSSIEDRRRFFGENIDKIKRFSIEQSIIELDNLYKQNIIDVS